MGKDNKQQDQSLGVLAGLVTDLSRNRKEGSKSVTWDELVRVRTIESLEGTWGHGKWKQPRHWYVYVNQPRLGHWEQPKQNCFDNSVTSPIYDI